MFRFALQDQLIRVNFIDKVREWVSRSRVMFLNPVIPNKIEAIIGKNGYLWRVNNIDQFCAEIGELYECVEIIRDRVGYASWNYEESKALSGLISTTRYPRLQSAKQRQERSAYLIEWIEVFNVIWGPDFARKLRNECSPWAYGAWLAMEKGQNIGSMEGN